MAAKRIIYAIIVLAAAAAFVVSNSNIALFVLLCLLLLPLVSLCLLLIARKKVKFEMSVRDSCIRGGKLQLTVRSYAAPRFLLGAVKVTVAIENTTFGKTEYQTFVINDLSFGNYVFDYVSEDSGRISVQCDYIKLLDIFGLFALKIFYPIYAEAIVSPMLFDDAGVTVADRGADSVFGDMVLPKKGSDITEVYDVRDYIAGDAPSSVHWKLSGKFGALKTKEFGATDDRKILILVDMSRNKYGVKATDAQLNGVLDVTASISNALKSANLTHSVGWFNGGEFESSEVSDGDTFVRTVGKLMSAKVNEGNEETLFYLSRTAECGVFTKIIFISSAINNDEFKDVTEAEFTAIEVANTSGEAVYQGVRVINIPAGNIHDALTTLSI